MAFVCYLGFGFSCSTPNARRATLNTQNDNNDINGTNDHNGIMIFLTMEYNPDRIDREIDGYCGHC